MAVSLQQGPFWASAEICFLGVGTQVITAAVVLQTLVQT
jgi:hypothetical protein